MCIRDRCKKPPPAVVGLSNAVKQFGMKSDGEQVHKQMLAKLRAEEYSSPLMDRITQVVSVEGLVKEQEEELLQEIASALRRTEQSLLFACLEVEVAGRAADTAAAQGDRKLCELVDTFNALRKKAHERRHALTVHRQACGFRVGNREIVEDTYPIPTRRNPNNTSVADALTGPGR
eukprot:TRINITY_DN4089_c0_g2_i1.p1 TRINITY_DN4089_c0_g2~~TRINITY_DN4089_c0_g2_i1.p1  ORF type:complete len:176 (+),score=54.61 TRINITY_DN4089_c0_g2_i1:88-615(+)